MFPSKQCFAKNADWNPIFISTCIYWNIDQTGLHAAKEFDGPFPWRKPSANNEFLHPSKPKIVVSSAKRLRRPTILEGEPPESPLLQLCAESQALGIRFDLPAAGIVAGSVLHHASCRIDSLFHTYEPMIWNVGFTHHPVWRWSNEVYGYQHSRDLWSQMVVLHIATEPHGPAMLESALIDKFRCSLGCKQVTPQYYTHYKTNLGSMKGGGSKKMVVLKQVGIFVETMNGRFMKIWHIPTLGNLNLVSRSNCPRWTQVSLAVAMSDLAETQWRPMWPQQRSTTWFISCTDRSNTLQRWSVTRSRTYIGFDKKFPVCFFHTGAKCKGLLLTSDKAYHRCKTIRLELCLPIFKDEISMLCDSIALAKLWWNKGR